MALTPEAKGSTRAENRVKRRFARLKERAHDLGDIYTRDPLMAELAMAQIDATLSLSHAVQELGEYLDRMEYQVLKQGVPPFGSKAKTEAHIGAIERDVRWLSDQMEGLRKVIGEEIERKIQASSPPVHPAPNTAEVASNPSPWWKFWDD